ncbi:MAG: type II CAAX endopeptidase family protein [Cytophagales bacterium]|nr:type II CAAX endopeptidase family protein [Cytophagales bacterium]
MFSFMADTGKTDWWRFALTFVIVITGYLVGQIPLLAALYARKEALSMSEADFERHFNNTNLAAFEMDPNVLLILMMLPFVIGFLLIIMSIKYIHQREIKSLFTGKEAFDWKKCFFGFSIWTLLSVPAIWIMIPADNLTYQLEWSKFLPLLALALLLVPIQTTMEETFFRGYLFQSLTRVFNSPMWPFLIIGIGFALLHAFNPEFSEGFTRIIWAYLLLSFFFGILPLLDNGLELPIGLHAANNLVVVLFITAEGGAFSTPAIFSTDLPTLVDVLPILLPTMIIVTFMILMFRYQWSFKGVFSRRLNKF